MPLKESALQPPPVGQSMTDEQWTTWFKLVSDLMPKVSSYEVVAVPANVGANSSITQTYTITGLATSDVVYMNTQQVAGLVVDVRVSASGTLSIAFTNTTGGAVSTPGGTYTVMAIRK